MADAGFPKPPAGVFMADYAESVGQPALVSGAVSKTLDRPVPTFDQWAAEHADAFRP